MVLTGITSTSTFGVQMYNKTKKQAKQLGKKLPKNVKEAYKNVNKSPNVLSKSSNVLSKSKDIPFKGINHDTINYFEPKMNNRWLVEFPKEFHIESYFVKSVIIPNYCMDISNNVLQISLYEPVSISIAQQLTEMMNNHVKFKLKLDRLDPLGLVTEKWKFKNCNIHSINFSSMDYSNSSPSVINLFIKFENLKIKI